MQLFHVLKLYSWVGIIGDISKGEKSFSKKFICSQQAFVSYCKHYKSVFHFLLLWWQFSGKRVDIYNAVSATILLFHNVQITNKCTSMFMMYFIQNVLTNTFQLLLWPSSGCCYYYNNTKVQMWSAVSPSFRNN